MSKRKPKAVPIESDSENESESDGDSDSDIPEGINDLMNLPTGLLRKELISRKFEPTVINNLPHWQLSAMLRESSSTGYDSFFHKIMGYLSYWDMQNKPAFTKKSLDELQKDDDNDEEKDEEESSEDDNVNVMEFKKTHRKKSYSNNDEGDGKESLDPNNYTQKFINNQFRYFPKTLVVDHIFKREVPKEYQPPVVESIQEIPIQEPIKSEKDQNEIIEDLNRIPTIICTELLNYGVMSGSIDELTPEQVKEIRESVNPNDFNPQDLIDKYNLQMYPIMDEDSQFPDTQTQNNDEKSENSDDGSDDSSDSDSSDDSSSDDSDNHKSEKDNEDEDDHTNDIF